MKKHYRQGDVLLLKIKDKLPADAIKQDNKKRVVLAYGEVTGHAHAVSTDYATMYTWNGARLLEVKEGGKLVHEEHSTIPLEPGLYEVRQQREYHPEAIRNVTD